MTTIILIRHGQTAYNASHRYVGFSNPPLNEKGQWQIQRLAGELQNKAVNKVYSSDLLRAHQSATILFEQQITKLPAFREMNFGIFEGLNYQEIMSHHSQIYQKWITAPEKVKIPQGESLQEVTCRVNHQLKLLLKEHTDQTIAIVTHSGPIKIILSAVLKAELNDIFWDIEQKNSALNIIDYRNPSAPKIIDQNNYSHLTKKRSACFA